MTVMFSDIRNFTSMAERMEPREVFNFINAYFQRISPEIRNHGGFVAKFIGDGMMAVFPERVEDGIDSAIAQLAQVRAHNDQHQETGWPQIEVGIALHMGHLMVGMIGEESRIQGDAISDTVNLAARLEGLTKLYGVALLVSESVVKRLKNPQSYQLRFLDRAIVKGRREAIAIYEVLDGEASNQRALKCQTLAIFDRAIQAYGRGDFDAAKADFSQVLKINPLDHPAQLYLERLAQFAAQGTPENWDGTWYFTQKR
jgi:adenylate cyclase